MLDNLLHERDVKVRAFSLEDDLVLIVGRLIDIHPEPDEEAARVERKAVGALELGPVIHDMTLELEVSAKDFKIKAARARMQIVPHLECRDVEDSVQELVGLTVTSGFTMNVKERLGGAKSCAHLVSLVLTMAPVVVQVAKVERHVPIVKQMAYLTDTCYMWRENGPVITRLTENENERLATRPKPAGIAEG